MLEELNRTYIIPKKENPGNVSHYMAIKCKVSYKMISKSCHTIKLCRMGRIWSVLLYTTK